MLRLPDTRTANDRRQVLRAAIRQLDRAELYMVAVEHMEVDDSQARRLIHRLRADLESLRIHLSELRAETKG